MRPPHGTISRPKRSRPCAAACQDIAPGVKIRSIDAGLVVEIPVIADAGQIARLRQWLLDEASL
jgi:hypothetical protein